MMIKWTVYVSWFAHTSYDDHPIHTAHTHFISQENGFKCNTLTCTQIRGRHGPEKKTMLTNEMIHIDKNSCDKIKSTLESLEISSSKKKKGRGRKKKSQTKDNPKKSRRALSKKSKSRNSLDPLEARTQSHPNQVDSEGDKLILLPSLSFRSSTGDPPSYAGGDHSLASLDSGGANSFNFNPRDLDLNFSALPSLDQYPSMSSIADSLDDIAITPRLLKDLVE